MATTARTRTVPPRKGARQAVTDRQRANALLWLANGGEEVVENSEIDRVLSTIAPNHVVRVRRTPRGFPVYRVTAAGQRWAVAQLAVPPGLSATAHSGRGRAANLVRKGPGDQASPTILIEENQSGDWRAIDYARHVRTPWLGIARTSIIERAAKLAVRRTDPKKLIAHRHTRDDDWVIVHSL